MKRKLELCPSCGKRAKLETHHNYPIHPIRNGGPTQRLCRSCHAKIPKLSSVERWHDNWFKQFIHPETPLFPMSIKINPRSGLVYIPEKIREQGFRGACQLLSGVVTAVLIRPGSSLVDVKQSIKNTLNYIKLREKYL